MQILNSLYEALQVGEQILSRRTAVLFVRLDTFRNNISQFFIRCAKKTDFFLYIFNGTFENWSRSKHMLKKK